MPEFRVGSFLARGGGKSREIRRKANEITRKRELLEMKPLTFSSPRDPREILVLAVMGDDEAKVLSNDCLFVSNIIQIPL